MTRSELEDRLDKNFSTEQLITILNAAISARPAVAGDIVNFADKLDRLYPNIVMLQSYFYLIDRINELHRALELAGFVADVDEFRIDDDVIEVIYDKQGLHIVSFPKDQVIRYIVNAAETNDINPTYYSDEVSFLTRLLEVALW